VNVVAPGRTIFAVCLHLLEHFAPVYPLHAAFLCKVLETGRAGKGQKKARLSQVRQFRCVHSLIEIALQKYHVIPIQ